MGNYQIRGDVLVSTPPTMDFKRFTLLINSQCHYLINLLHGTYSRYSTLLNPRLVEKWRLMMLLLHTVLCVDGGCH